MIKFRDFLAESYLEEFRNSNNVFTYNINDKEGNKHTILTSPSFSWVIDIGGNKLNFGGESLETTKPEVICDWLKKKGITNYRLLINTKGKPSPTSVKTRVDRMNSSREDGEKISYEDITLMNDVFGDNWKDLAMADKKDNADNRRGYKLDDEFQKDELPPQYSKAQKRAYEILGGKWPVAISDFEKTISYNRQDKNDNFDGDMLNLMCDKLTKQQIKGILDGSSQVIHSGLILKKLGYNEDFQHFVKVVNSGNENIPEEMTTKAFLLNIDVVRNAKENINVDDKKKDAETRAQNKEINIAKSVNDWIKRDETKTSNPNIDNITTNKDDKFYSVHTGQDSRKSDVLVVHDKPPFNKEKTKPGKQDKTFFIEAKLSEEARSFNPSVKIVKTGNGFEFKYNGPILQKSQLDAVKAVDNKIAQDQKQQTNEGSIEDEKYRDIMSSGELGETLTKILGSQCRDTLQAIDNACKLYDVVNQNNVEYKIVEGTKRKISNVEFPRDFDNFPQMFDMIFEYLVALRDNVGLNYSKEAIDKITEFINGNNINLERMLKLYNEKFKGRRCSNITQVDEILNMLDDREKKVMMIYLVNSDVLRISQKKISTKDEPELLDELADRIISWYCDYKKTAYLEIGPNDNYTHTGGVYIFKKDFDPLDLQTKYANQIQTFKGALKGAYCLIRKQMSSPGFVANFILDITPNGLQMERILNDDFVMNQDDDKNDKTKFFKENEK